MGSKRNDIRVPRTPADAQEDSPSEIVDLLAGELKLNAKSRSSGAMLFLPPSTNHQYVGSPLSAYGLGLLAILTLVPACIHSFLPDGGAGVIAGLNMGDRRDMIIGAFRWEGATQMALGLGMLIVAVRYRTLTPIFLSLVILERGLMALEGWVLSPPADGHHPPEHFASIAAVIFAAAALALSLRLRRA